MRDAQQFSKSQPSCLEQSPTNSDSAIDLPEAEDVFDKFCDRGFSASREIRTAFFHPVRLLAGSAGPIFKIQGDKYPL